MKRILTFILCLAFFGCAFSARPRGVDSTRGNFVKLKPGMSKNDASIILGPPHKHKVYTTDYGRVVEFWLYITETTYADLISDNDITPVCFLDGKVTGWGKRFYISEREKYGVQAR